MLNKRHIITAISLLCSWIFIAQGNGNVGIGTTTPQAKLEVDGGNVRFSEYGTNMHTGTPEYLLGVEADGDIVEVPVIEEVRGLQFYFWHGFDRINGAQNGTIPAIDVVDMRRLSTFIPASGTAVGPPVNSGLYTGPLFLTNTGNGGSVDLDGPPPSQVIRTESDNYVLIFKGTLDVQNTGLFEFTATGQDGIRMMVDDVIIINDWVIQGAASTTNGSITLTRGKHEVEFWYFENRATDRIQFEWGANPDGYIDGSTILATQFIIE